MRVGSSHPSAFWNLPPLPRAVHSWGGGGGLWPGQEATFLIGTWKLMAKGQAQAELGLCVGKEIRGPALWSLTFEDFLPEIKESE